MSADQLENELVRKISELQQEAKEHQLVLDAFKSVEPERKCFRLIGGVLVERTVKDIKPNLEENLVNIEKAIGNISESITKRREERAKDASVLTSNGVAATASTEQARGGSVSVLA